MHINDIYRVIFDKECDGRSGKHPQNLSFEDWLAQQSPIEIEPEQIALKSWIAIATKCKCWSNVATSRWIETMPKKYLTGLTVEDWMELAAIAGLSEGWGFNRWKENKSHITAT